MSNQRRPEYDEYEEMPVKKKSSGSKNSSGTRTSSGTRSSSGKSGTGKKKKKLSI